MAQGATTREQPPVAQWDLPVKGVVKGIKDLNIPQDALFDSSNAELTEGTVRGRLGLTQFTSQLFGATPLDALNFWESSTASWLILATTNKIWTYEAASATWTDRSGSLTGTIDNSARITQFEFSGLNRAYICNGVDAFKTWKPGDAIASNVGGSPPVFKDICTAADRLVGVVGTHEVRWSEPLTDASYPAANSKLFTETPAPVIAVRNLGVLGVVVYKKDSIWGGDVTGLAGASAFRFNMVEQVEGPAGPNAVVDCDGLHVYMTAKGRIGIYNGFIRKWVADGVWSVVKAEIDQTKPNRVHGVYIPDLFQVRFYYKRIGASDTDGVVILNLERKDLGLPYSSWPGRMGKSITAGCKVEDAAISTNTSLVFANNAAAERTYTIAGATDDGVAVSSHIQTGLTLPAKLESARALSLEAFVERLAGYGTVNAKLVYSNVLDKIEGYLSASSSINLETVPIKNPIGFDVRGRFLGLRLEWTSSATVRYRGAVLRGAETP